MLATHHPVDFLYTRQELQALFQYARDHDSVAYLLVSRLMIQFVVMVLLTVARWPLMQTWISQHPVIATILALGMLLVLLIVFKRPRARLLSPVKHERIAIAEVHAAILSIFIAAVSGYVGLSYTSLNEIEHKALQEAEAINRLTYEGHYGDPTAEMYVSSNANNRRKLLSRFSGLIVEDLDPSEIGEEALRILSALYMYYPFPKRITTDGSGHVTIGPPQPLFFTTLEELRQWVLDLEEVTRVVDHIRSPTLQESLGAYFRKWVNTPESVYLKLTAAQIEAMTKYRSIMDHIVQQMRQANEIAEEARSFFRQLETAKKRQPTGEIIGGLMGAGIAFLCGVLLPMFWPKVPEILLLWIPSVFYIIAFTYIVHFLWKLLAG